MDVTKIISWLPFNESTTQDLLGNTWTAYGTPTLENGALILDGASCLKLDGSLTLGGKDFTVRTKGKLDTSTAPAWCGLFCFGNKTIRIQRNNSNTAYIEIAINGSYQNVSTDALTSDFDIEIDYTHESGTWKTFVNGKLICTTNKTLAETTFTAVYIGGNGENTSGGARWGGTIDEFMILDGVALHTENFTPPTAEDYADWQLAVAGYAPAKISFDVETYLRNAQKGWRVYNPGEAELLATDGATTVEVPYTQSVTGKAFYGGTLSDMFHTPAGLKEIWIRFDAVNFPRDSIGGNFYVGHWSTTQNRILGMRRSDDAFQDCTAIKLINTDVAHVQSGQFNKYLLHIKSDATDGLVELTIDKDTYTQTGNINGGEDLNNIVFYTSGEGTYFSNVVVSETELTLDDGWHRDSFGVETKIHAPVLNVRLQGSNVKFPLSTKRKANSRATLFHNCILRT